MVLLTMSGSRSPGLLASDAPVLARSCSGRKRKESVAVGVPAASVPLQLCIRHHGFVRVEEGEGVLSTVSVAAGGAQRSHGREVAAALGGEVTPIAEHVRPAAQRLEVLMRMLTELEAGGNQPPLVSARIGIGRGVLGGAAFLARATARRWLWVFPFDSSRVAGCLWSFGSRYPSRRSFTRASAFAATVGAPIGGNGQTAQTLISHSTKVSFPDASFGP